MNATIRSKIDSVKVDYLDVIVTSGARKLVLPVRTSQESGVLPMYHDTKYCPASDAKGYLFAEGEKPPLQVKVVSELNLTVGYSFIVELTPEGDFLLVGTESPTNQGENMHPNAYENGKEGIAELNVYEKIKAGIDELNVCTTYLEAMQALLSLMPYASDAFLGEVVAKDFSGYEDGSLGQTLADAYGGNKTLRKFMRSVAKAILMDRR